MTPTEIAVTLVAVFVSAVLWRIVIRLLIAPKLRAHRNRREAERFKTNPRVGDKAGYELTDGTWMIGEVDTVLETGHLSNFATSAIVHLRTLHITALGEEARVDRWSTVDLCYFPPPTPLGIVTMDKTKEIDR